MLIASKIKIAAMLLLVCGVSAGAGVLYLASHGELPPAAQSQVAAPAVNAVIPAIPNLPAIADVTAGFDPRIAPFVTERTDILLTVDLTKLDLNALGADMHDELVKDKLSPQSTAQINGLLQMGVAGGKQWISAFQQAGGTSVYVISRSDELRLGTPGGGGTLKLTGDVVYPAAPPEAALSLMSFLRRSGLTQLKVVGSAVVDPTSAPPISPTASTAPVEFDPRPSLASGLAASGDSPVRIAINPAKLKEIIPKLMASGKLSSTFTGNEWDGVQYASMNLQLPPNENPAFIIISHYNDAASAQAAAKMSADRVEKKLKEPGVSTSPLTASMLKFMATETFAATGSDVIGTMDLHAYYDLLFQAVSGAFSAGGFAAAMSEAVRLK